MSQAQFALQFLVVAFDAPAQRPAARLAGASPGPRRLEDAVSMRAHVLDAFERAEASLDPKERLRC